MFHWEYPGWMYAGMDIQTNSQKKVKQADHLHPTRPTEITPQGPVAYISSF